MKNKNARIVFETVIFLVLNIVFFVIMLTFVYSAGEREFVYEQTLAKEIALILDNAKPNTIISLNFEKYIDIAKDNHKDLDKIIQIKNNRVLVSLKPKGGYSFEFFSDYDIELNFQEEILLININEKGIKNE